VVKAIKDIKADSQLTLSSRVMLDNDCDDMHHNYENEDAEIENDLIEEDNGHHRGNQITDDDNDDEDDDGESETNETSYEENNLK
jgi:hypothetical protein